MRKLSTLFLLCLSSTPVFAQFMRGKVVMQDGSAPPQKALIERVCPSAKPVQEAVANKLGEFVWRINNDTTAYKLVTIGNQMPLRCLLRARINGFESNAIDIGDPVVMNNPELPRLILHPAGDAPAPELPKLSRAAIKAWDLGAKAITTQQWPDAERYLRAVTQAAPGFGLAWSGLGYALQSQQKSAEARDAYRRAIAADPASLLSRVQLARMEVAAKQWTEAAATAAALIAADREHRYPEAFLHHGLARYALKDHDGARASLLEAIRLDAKHEMPQAEYLLGATLNAKGDRTGAAEHLSRYLDTAPEAPNAAFVRDQIARLTRPAAVAAPEPAMPVPDEILPAETEPTIAATGEARIPGGRKALAAIARLPRVPESAAFFPEYCRAVADETSPLSEHHTPGYSAALEAFLESASELADLGERRGDRTHVVLSLAPDTLPRTERALALLGWKVVRGEGMVAVEPGDRAADAPRHAVARALGIDEAAMRDALTGGRSFSFEVASENVPLAGGSAWGALLQGFASLPGGVAQGFVRQPRLARACAGLGRLEPATAISLARSIGLRTLVNLYADSLWQNADAFRMSGGRVATPGGAAAEDIWAKLVGATPRDATKFFEALLRADKGRVAPFYSAVARGDASHQAWFTKDAARAQRFYAWFRDVPRDAPRDAPRPLSGWRPLLFQDLPLDTDGNIRYPGGRSAWTKSASDDDVIAPLARIGNLRMLRSSDAVDLESLLAVARLERERGRPFDAQSAGLLWRHFAEWHDLFPYFAQLPAMDGGEFQALAGFAAAAAAVDPASQALLAAQWHSSVALLLAARRAGSLDDARAAHAFGDLCLALAAAHPEAGVMGWLRTLESAAPDLDEGVARLLRLSGPARAEFDRIRDLQHAPRFTALGNSPAPSAVASALSGAAYAALLRPDGLLINEDPRLLAKHLWIPRAQMFATASLVASNSGEGSHFAGGFAGFDEIARSLASGGAAQTRPTASAAPESGDSSIGTLFRADARLVEVHTTVTEEGGRYLDGLAADRFTIRENGHAVPIASFEPATAPISCALVLDTSESMDAALPALKSAAAKLITSLRADDPVAVYTLGGSLAELQPFTTDHATAARAVGRAEPGGETALYDALVRVNRDLSVRPGKKVIVVFTDGEDNASTLTAATAILRARTAGIPIYTIAQGHALNHSTLLRDLSGISRATGGLSFTIAGPEEIGNVFRSILQDLLHGYLLAFRPPLVEDRTWRKIEVQVRAVPGLSVRAREGYYPE